MIKLKKKYLAYLKTQWDILKWWPCLSCVSYVCWSKTLQNTYAPSTMLITTRMESQHTSRNTVNWPIQWSSFVFCFVLGTGSHYVDHPGIIGRHHHTWPRIIILYRECLLFSCSWRTEGRGTATCLLICWPHAYCYRYTGLYTAVQSATWGPTEDRLEWHQQLTSWRNTLLAG